MSLFAALFTGVSDLSAQGSAMSVISNNIANVNTVGYKADVSAFSSLVTNSSSSAGQYSPGGVLAYTQSTISEQGTLEQTNSPTDMAISGNGFFVVRPEASSSAPVYYTRAGSFTPNSDGYLANTAGMVLYGYPLTGGVAPGNSDISSLQPVNVALLGGKTNPTANAGLSLNVDSATATAGTFSRNVTVYDSLGAPETLALTFTKTSTNNAWTLQVQDGAGNNLLPLNTGHTPNDHTVDVTFNSNGTIDQVGTTAGNTTLTVAGTAGTGIVWGNGSSAQSIAINMSSVTQYDASSSVTNITQDGTALGLYTGASVDSNGIVSATFSNGTTEDLYQLPIATFSNPDGLEQVSGNAYNVTTASGAYNLQLAGASGAGTVAPSSLEQSNVDLATEFSNMIVTQRSYSAGTKIISTIDQMLQDLTQIQ